MTATRLLCDHWACHMNIEIRSELKTLVGMSKIDEYYMKFQTQNRANADVSTLVTECILFIVKCSNATVRPWTFQNEKSE